jgi:hypothetical protein
MNFDKTSPEYITQLLLDNDKAVERAIVVLFYRQTKDEQEANKALDKNGRGFSKEDASLGSYLAKWILEKNRLTGKWLVSARTMSQKYVNQLVEEATIKIIKDTGRRPDFI